MDTIERRARLHLSPEDDAFLSDQAEKHGNTIGDEIVDIIHHAMLIEKRKKECAQSLILLNQETGELEEAYMLAWEHSFNMGTAITKQSERIVTYILVKPGLLPNNAQGIISTYQHFYDGRNKVL